VTTLVLLLGALFAAATWTLVPLGLWAKARTWSAISSYWLDWLG
jgi:hypothetical protein